MAANTCVLSIYTYKDISDAVYAKKLVSICKEAGLRWEKIGMYEPLRTPYTDDLFYQYWSTSKKAGRNAESMTEYANVLCSQDRGSIQLMAGWKKSAIQKYSAIDFFMTRKAFRLRTAEFERLLFLLIDAMEPDYASVHNWRFWVDCREINPPKGPVQIQNVDANAYFSQIKKVPMNQDVHWITYFSHNRMREMKCSVDELSWYKRIDLPQGAVCYMCGYIPKDGDPIEAKCLEYRSALWGVEMRETNGQHGEWQDRV